MTMISVNGEAVTINASPEIAAQIYDAMRSTGLHIDTIEPMDAGLLPDDLPKVKSEGALSEEDAKYLEFYRKTQEDLAASHQHEFTYLLNNNHTALRGCPCGLAFVGLMAGPSPDALQWHQIHEENEQG